jgi:DNA-directed RNA polymerase subunit RPC12/RpoP
MAEQERPDPLDHTSVEGVIVCPWCGHKDNEAWDHAWGDRECLEGLECGECGREFSASVHVSYSYTTRRTEEVSHG